MTTAASIDQLVHHSVILETNLPSYRMEADAQKRRWWLRPPWVERSLTDASVGLENAILQPARLR